MASRRRFAGLFAATCVMVVGLASGCTGAPVDSNQSPGTAPTSSASSAPSPEATAIPSARSTPVSAPSGGSTDTTVAANEQSTSRPAKLSKPVQSDDGVSVSLTSITSVKATANGPGEISGPALAVTVEIKNGGSAPLDVSSAVITLLDSKNNPGLPMTSEPARPFAETIAPGAQATGIYVFTIAEKVRKPISVLVSYSASAPVAHFKGEIA